MLKLKIDKPAIKALSKLLKSSPKNAGRIKERIVLLRQKGKTYQCIALQNISPITYRSRIGDYRVIYQIHGNELLVINIGHRKDVYSKTSF